MKQKNEGYKRHIQERTDEDTRHNEEIKEKMDSNDESITLADRREFSDQLEQLESDWLEILEDTLDEILPEAYAVLKDTCRRFVGKKWMVAGSEIEWDMITYDEIGRASCRERVW